MFLAENHLKPLIFIHFMTLSAAADGLVEPGSGTGGEGAWMRYPDPSKPFAYNVASWAAVLPE
jgi:hypothetical protein